MGHLLSGNGDEGVSTRSIVEGEPEELPSRFKRSQDHHEAYQKLIRWELDDELASTERRLRNWSRERLVSNGVALFDLVAKPDGWLFDQRVVKLGKRGRGDLGSHRFRQGDIVMLSRGDPLSERPIEAIVSERRRNSIKIVLPELPSDIRKDSWRMDRGANRVAYDRMRDALNAIFQEEGGAPLRELILGLVHDPAGTASLPPQLGGVRGRSYSLDMNLNEAQRSAAKAAVEQRMTLIQGPPGTGKTHTAVRILEAWAQQDMGTVLAVADSNVAVDNLLEGLLKLGVRAVRLGQPVKVREGLREATMDALMEKHPLRRDLVEHLELNEKLGRKIKGMRGGKEKGLAHRDLSRGWKEVRKIEGQMRDDILDKAQVLCCTCIGSGHELLDGRRFPQVLLDESTQATEPASLVPIVRGARQVVLVGDHKQLPPTVISRRAESGGLSKSLFERMMGMGIEAHLLTTQYRMHPAISEFPNGAFYDGLLVDGVDSDQRPTPAGILWPDWDAPIAFIPVDGGEAAPDGESKENAVEASWVSKIVEGLVDTGDVGMEDIGVITPYAAQVRAIRDVLPESIQDVEVKTVDGYQGREKEVIVFSCVRSNSDGKVGFLSDPRRLNVALTRARRGLIVIGDPATLRFDENWEGWLRHARERNFEAWHILGMS